LGTAFVVSTSAGWRLSVNLCRTLLSDANFTQKIKALKKVQSINIIGFPVGFNYRRILSETGGLVITNDVIFSSQHNGKFSWLLLDLPSNDSSYIFCRYRSDRGRFF